VRSSPPRRPWWPPSGHQPPDAGNCHPTYVVGLALPRRSRGGASPPFGGVVRCLDALPRWGEAGTPHLESRLGGLWPVLRCCSPTPGDRLNGTSAHPPGMPVRAIWLPCRTWRGVATRTAAFAGFGPGGRRWATALAWARRPAGFHWPTWACFMASPTKASPSSCVTTHRSADCPGPGDWLASYERLPWASDGGGPSLALGPGLCPAA